jgi:hypothetical protein
VVRSEYLTGYLSGRADGSRQTSRELLSRRTGNRNLRPCAFRRRRPGWASDVGDPCRPADVAGLAAAGGMRPGGRHARGMPSSMPPGNCLRWDIYAPCCGDGCA